MFYILCALPFMVVIFLSIATRIGDVVTELKEIKNALKEALDKGVKIK